MNLKNPAGRLARWVVYLQEYDFTIKHRPGSLHTNADYLSRPVLTINNVAIDHDSEEINKIVDIYEDEAFLYYIQHGRHLPGTTKSKCKRINYLANHYFFQDGIILYRKNENARIKSYPN